MSLWTAYTVDPDTVTPAEIAEVCAELGVDTDVPTDDDFFQTGATYRRNGDTFRCVAVGIRDGSYPAAIGYLPINLAAGPTWEFAAMTSWEWRRGWIRVPRADQLAPAEATEADEKRPFTMTDYREQM